MDDAIRKALKRQKELRLEIDKLERFIVTYEELSGTKIPRDEMTLAMDIGENSTQLREQTANEVPPKRRNNLKKLLSLSEKIIDNAGRPLTRTELADRMELEGVTIHANDIPKYLGTLLWRNSDRFVSADGHGYMTKAMAQERRSDVISDASKAVSVSSAILHRSRDNDDGKPSAIQDIFE